MHSDCKCNYCDDDINPWEVSVIYNGEKMHIDCAAKEMDDEYDPHCMSSD